MTIDYNWLFWTGCIRRAGKTGSGAQGKAGRKPEVVAVLLGHGRRGELDKGERTDCINNGNRPRSHNYQLATLQAQGEFAV